MIYAKAARLVVAASLALVPATVRAQATAPSLRLRDGAREVTLSGADLRALARRELRVSGDESSDSSTVAGFTLWDVLQKAGIPSSQASGRQRAATYVRLVGADGQTAFFALVELDPSFSRRVVLVADHRNGSALDATEGRLRVIAPDDVRHARWIRGLVRIDVGTLPP